MLGFLNSRTCLVIISIYLACWLSDAVVSAREPVELESAISLFKHGRYDEAEKKLRKMLERASTCDDDLHREARLWLALLLIETGRYDEAEQMLRASIECRGEAVEERGKKAKDTKQQLSGLRERNTLVELMILRGRYEEAFNLNEETIEKFGNDIRSMMLKGIILHETGRKDEASECFGWCIDYYQSHEVEETAELLTTVAIAGRYYADRAGDHEMIRTVARDFFPAAIEEDKFHYEAYLELARLFLDKYNHIDATYYCNEALKLNACHPAIRAMLAECLLAGGMVDEASKEIRRALSKNPHLPHAHFLSAVTALLKNDYKEALIEAEKVLAVNPHHLGGLAVRAAVAKMRGLEEETKRNCEQAEKINPQCAEFYHFIGEMCTRNMRFAEATSYYRRAVELDPKFGKAYCSLGLNLIRNGEEEEGREILEKAWQLDRLNNVWLTNILRLLDDFDEEFVIHQTEHFIIRMSAEESPILRGYVTELLERAYSEMTEKYGFKPSGKTKVYLFGRHEDLSVMTIGLVGIGALGVCFGKMIAADSPSVRNLELFGGSFNWGQVLWHEFAHVVTVQMSNYRTPRWLTEGIAVYEEKCGRKQWGRDLDYPLLVAYQRGELLPLKDLEAGFVNPATILLCYYHASKIVEYTIERYGIEKICELLKAYSEGLSDEEAFARVFGKTLCEFDNDFQEWLEKWIAGVKIQPVVPSTQLEAAIARADNSPGDPEAHAALAWAYYCSGDYLKAETSSLRAIGLAPGNGLALQTLGHVYYTQKRKEKALEYYRKAHQAGVVDFWVHFNAGRILAEKNDIAAAIDEMEKARECFPTYLERDANPYVILVDLYKKAGMLDDAMRVLEDYVALCEDDFEAMMELASYCEANGEKEKALNVLESASFLRPINIRLHVTKGKLLKELGRLDEAIEAYRIGALLAQRANRSGRDDKTVCELYCEVAELCIEKGLKEDAREYLEEALLVDPENKRARELKLRLEGK